MRSVRPGQQARPPTKREARGALRRAVVSRTEPGGAPLAVVKPGSSGDSEGSGSLTWPQPRLRSPLCPQHAVLWGGGRAWTCRSPSGRCALPLTCPPVSRDDPSPVAGTGRRPRPSRRGRQSRAGRGAVPFPRRSLPTRSSLARSSGATAGASLRPWPEPTRAGRSGQHLASPSQDPGGAWLAERPTPYTTLGASSPRVGPGVGTRVLHRHPLWELCPGLAPCPGLRLGGSGSHGAAPIGGRKGVTRDSHAERAACSVLT